MEALKILFEDEHIIAVNKPYGYVIHNSKMVSNADQILLQELRDQLGYRIHTIHRLDRKTTGIVLFGKSKEAASMMAQNFMDRAIQKLYIAVVRGWLSKTQDTIDYDLTNDKGKVQNAITEYKRLKEFELNIPLGKHQTSRYSLVELKPHTGRFHQIRKHMNHLRHPILGDRPHGCSKQNRLWLNRFDYSEMMLHASELHFVHPISSQKIILHAPHSSEWERVMHILSSN